MSARLEEPLTKALGARTAGAFAKLGLETVGDLLEHYPRRYEAPGRLTDLATLVPGEHVTVLARVQQATVRRMRSRDGALLEVRVTDGVGSLDLTFFARKAGVLGFHERRLVPGRTALFTGTVGEYRGRRQLSHPDYELLGADGEGADEAIEAASRPIPIYPAGASVATWQIHRAVRTVLDTLAEDEVPDPVPHDVLAERGLVPRFRALHDLHVPTTDAEWRRGRVRVRFEEAFVLQTALAQRRTRAERRAAAARPPRPGPGVLAAFDASLPFTLTGGQREVGATIAADLARDRPMRRLLQGEVGSGKTVVALRAMLQVVDAGGQAALLAPTEVLAAQHARSLAALLGPLAEGGMLGGTEHATRVALLTGSLGAAARKAALLDAASGAAGIVVGTHALLGDQVQFADLGLVVVDEQHRFGVEQRDALRAKGSSEPHLLVMTATPIPRTVAMTVFGDLETSALTEVPAGRAARVTHVVPASNDVWVRRTWARVREEVDAGRRAYVVAPRIHPDDPGAADGPAGPTAPAGRPGTDETDDVLDFLDEPTEGGAPPLRAVLEVAEELRAAPELAGVGIGVLHGQLPPADKDRAMAAFADGSVPVLVATTVVEVGVDVPQATVMVVLDAERFGISQLHQLRGRVGRGTDPGLCLLVSDAPPGSPGRARLDALAATTDGFELAEVDLELRREGDVLGAAQSGRSSSLRFLRVVQDAAVIEDARSAAVRLVADDPELVGAPALAAAIAERLDAEREEFLERA
ncbi:ATP-dependent DNA helicase RecG [Luteimicrobium subarcticum]|uniref:Probable DNA 3'-5' helicase RecG n=1 Tax=Luteimicrobium subarcticum TaxID=620910 RepID=A0A2M8WQP2_9MICO|nr:ATP-dependent DNA helicase RecG [Luteimicrobium subarcticum]PJI93261.1 ATP-dependent DNA helicase RecG [Luteimicrobium subarcticum]